MNWYLVHTKPRQEDIALDNLIRQTYECYLPTLSVEKIRRGHLTLVQEPLFPRYLFIRLGHGLESKSWSPIRSTLGVSRLVKFGTEPAKVDDDLISTLRSQEALHHAQPQKLFEAGQKIVVTQGPFGGIEGVFQMTEGDQRVMVLIELMSKQVPLRLAPHEIRAVS